MKWLDVAGARFLKSEIEAYYTDWSEDRGKPMIVIKMKSGNVTKLHFKLMDEDKKQDKAMKVLDQYLLDIAPDIHGRTFYNEWPN